MDRRKSLKTIAVGALATGVLVDACTDADKAEVKAKEAPKTGAVTIDRHPEETARYNEIVAKTFFTADEMAVITILTDIIIPRDEVSGSASDAGVPDFIEFIVKDKPELQVPVRGGLRWLEVQTLKKFSKSFKDCTEKERLEMVDLIAWPAKAKPENAQGVAFFNTMRNLTASGFYTSKIGLADIGYKGNTPNKWNGVPDEVLKQYGVAYSEREMKECAKYT
jgi:gluconate 2-dehydrogenase gamma chain